LMVLGGCVPFGAFFTAGVTYWVTLSIGRDGDDLTAQ
jgi:hypothetical protein